MTEIQDTLSDKHYMAIAREVEGRTGIKLPHSKRIMVEGRLRKRVRLLGLAGLRDYGRHLFDLGGLDAELIHLIDCVTTNKTDFFREPSHFEFLRDTAVPELLRRHSARPAKLKIWSAAASTGAEAYTIAMVLQEMAGNGRDFHYSILGTDISTEVIGQAKAGIYPASFVEPVPAAMQQRYLMRARNPAQDMVRIVPELRRRVAFEHLNLMDENYPFDRDIDVIFCRNVLIYFDRATQATVIKRLASHLRPGGYLLLGHSESTAGAGVDGLNSVGPTVYQTHGRSMRIAA